MSVASYLISAVLYTKTLFLALNIPFSKGSGILNWLVNPWMPFNFFGRGTCKDLKIELIWFLKLKMASLEAFNLPLHWGHLFSFFGSLGGYNF